MATIRIPEEMYAACEAKAEEGSWADAMRDMLLSWRRRRLRVLPDQGTRQVSMSMPVEVQAYLAKEQARLERATGQRWSQARVIRALWRESSRCGT